MSKIYFNFWDFKIKLDCESEKICDLLKKDFHYFLSEESAVNLEIKAIITKEINHLIPSDLIASKQNSRAMTFQDGSLRYNYFYGKAVSILDYAKSYIEVYSQTEEYLHELLYLVILSRQTKYHDLNGLHKVHAFGISKFGVNLVGMMDSKGGKTTLFSYFLDQEGVEIISDDSPMIDLRGNIKAFPIRIGYELNSYSRERLQAYEEKSYHFDRDEYDAKKLIDILEFRNKISENSVKNKTILFQGKRINSKDNCHYKKISKYKMWRYLMKNMVVGVGLPMVLEYYLESSFSDKFKNLKILISRAISAMRLLVKSDCYEVYLSFSPDENFKKLNELLELYKNE